MRGNKFTIYITAAILIAILATMISASDERRAEKQVRPEADAWLEVVLDDIRRKQTEVEAYTAAKPNRAFEMATPYWISFAVSQRARERYFADVSANQTRKTALNTALNALAAAAATKLPLYRPSDSVFANRNPQGEQMAVRGLKNGASVKLLKLGFEEANWLIEKNVLGIPLNRYKHGNLWARDNADDHPYCHLYVVYLQQDYTGGGKFGQPFTRIRDDQIVGCP